MTTALGKVWHQAGADLGLRVTAPFVLSTPNGEFLFDVLVHDFGSEQGMLLMESWSDEKAQAARLLGYGFSCLGAGAYDRSGFINVLQDWGWSGSSTAPAWLEA